MTFDPMSVEVTCVTLPKDHCVQVPWEYINVCGYSDQFCKLPHTYIHTTYILRTYYVQNEWSHSLLLNSVQARQKHIKIIKYMQETWYITWVCCMPFWNVSLSVFLVKRWVHRHVAENGCHSSPSGLICNNLIFWVNSGPWFTDLKISFEYGLQILCSYQTYGRWNFQLDLHTPYPWFRE